MQTFSDVPLMLEEDKRVEGEPLAVAFIHGGGPTMASFRYRAAIPNEYLNGVGVESCINYGKANVLVFSKPMDRDLELAKEAKARGCIIVTDVGDNHFNHPQLGSLYREIVSLAHYRVVPTAAMADVYKENGFPAHVIPDPYEMPEHAPHANGALTIWFGNKVNLPDLGKWEVDYLVTNDGGEGTIFYSPENLHRAMLEANWAFLPNRATSFYKSPNRLLNSLRMGLFPIVGNVPSHEEFRQYAWVGDARTGVRWANHHMADLNQIVRDGQHYIRDKYSPEAIGRQWHDFLEYI